VYIPYFFMAAVTIMAFCMALFLRHRHSIAAKIGFISWMSLIAYFIMEYIVIQMTAAPYNFLEQPVSDLGVTTCGTETYVLATYELCSPYHLLMNWTLTITGIAIFMGAICLHQFWPDRKLTRMATALLVIYGLTGTSAGIIPADMNFLWHTLGSLPAMVIQIPGLIFIGISIRKKWPKLSLWTFFCALLTTCAFVLILLFYQPFGLLQRILYGSVYLWMIVTAISLWIVNKIFKESVY